jgi:hypothetical protein
MIVEICRVMAVTGTLACGQPMELLDAAILMRTMPPEPLTSDDGTIAASGPFVRALPNQK